MVSAEYSICTNFRFWQGTYERHRNRYHMFMLSMSVPDNPASKKQYNSHAGLLAGAVLKVFWMMGSIPFHAARGHTGSENVSITLPTRSTP